MLTILASDVKFFLLISSFDQISGETERNGVWFPEDGDSCCKTG